MITYRERDVTTLTEIGRELIGEIDKYSLEMAQGSRVAAIALLSIMVPTYPDMPAKIRIQEVELARLNIPGGITKDEIMAIRLARESLFDFNKNFGFGTNAGQGLDWSVSQLGWFFEHLGCTLQGALHPDNQYGKDGMGFRGHLAMTTQHYYELLRWATVESTSSRA